MHQVYPGYYEYMDYLGVYVNVNGAGWTALDKYVDTGGEWAYPESLDDNTQRLNIDGAQYEDGLGIGLPASAGDTVQIAFQWKSDPAYCYEGAWIDDVCLLTQYGSLQPLVWQEYKPVFGAIDLEAFGTSGFQKEVQFHLPFTPEDDTTCYY